jgi:small subunit ribosomal protein S8
MAQSDPIADLLTRIRNAKEAKHRFVDVGISKEKVSIVKILKEQGFVGNYLLNDDLRKMRIFLKYDQDRQPLLQGLRRYSMPGLRRYVSYKDIPTILGGMGVAILSTSKGILDGTSAKKMQVGGELLCFVW